MCHDLDHCVLDTLRHAQRHIRQRPLAIKLNEAFDLGWCYRAPASFVRQKQRIVNRSFGGLLRLTLHQVTQQTLPVV